MQKEQLVRIIPTKCTICYTCVRNCPVKAIEANTEAEVPRIVSKRCIGCGDCITGCPAKAIEYRSSLDEAKQLLRSKSKKVAIVSPSISAEFEDITDYRKFVAMIRSLKIDHVNELSFAVDILAYKYLRFFDDTKGRYYISTTDPVVVNYVQKYRPNLIKNLSPFVSPMVAMAKIVRKRYGENIKVLYIGPDIASKDVDTSVPKDGKVDVVITFPELRALFKEKNIDENSVEFSDFDPPIGYKGSLYPLTNGFLQAADIDENLLTSNVVSVEGKDAMIDSIGEFSDNVKIIHRNLHVTYGNSLSGPGISNSGNRLFKEHLVIKYANKRLMNFFRAHWYDKLNKYMELDYSQVFNTDDQRLPKPPKEKVSQALKLLNTTGGRHHNCGQCGFDTCLSFAENMVAGVVVPDMCVTYAVQNNKNFSHTLKELNEKLASTRQELRETEEKVISEHDTAEQASELTDAMLEKLRAGIVIVDYQMKIFKANNTFCTILGEEAEEINEVIPGLAGAALDKFFPEEICNLFKYVLNNSESIDSKDVYHGDNLLNMSIFPIRENQIAGGIIRDMRAPEVQKSEVINRVSDVINKNLEMVQKMGFLLGESASDIERMLNSVIKIYGEENKS